jgi:hypothetical protein
MRRPVDERRPLVAGRREISAIFDAVDADAVV